MIVSPTEDCIAAKALRSELIEFVLIKPADDLAYGRVFSRAWEIGKTFINIEHDIAPWPGALQAMWDCSHDICLHEYMIGHSGKKQRALGCIKFDRELMLRHPDANYGWDETLWNHLDAQVLGATIVDLEIEPHVHEPPVAHIK